jgi:hypothetical protein
MSLLLILTLVQVWNTGAEMPTPRHAFACAAVGNRVFAIGGLAEEMRQPRAEVEAYDVDGDSWMTGFPSMPWPRAYAGCAVLDGKIYVIGGTDTRMETNRVDRFDPATNTWDTVASLPWPAQALGAAVLGNHLYAVGGYSVYNEGRYLKEVARFVPEPSPGSWQRVDSMHVPRAGLGLAVVGDRMYAVGGKYFNHLSSAEYFVGNRWYDEPMSMRYPRSDFPAVGYDNVVCAISGQGPSMRTGSVEVLNTLNGQWVEVEPLPSGRMGHGAAIVGDTMIVVVGGRDMERLIGQSLSHPRFITGIEEQPEELQPAPAGWATVASGRIRIAGEGRWELLDNSGRRVAQGIGAGEARMSPGVYFVRLEDPERGPVSAKVTVLK